MVFGVMRVVNFAHGALVMVSMYLTWLIFNHLGIDPFLALFITLPVMSVCRKISIAGYSLAV